MSNWGDNDLWDADYADKEWASDFSRHAIGFAATWLAIAGIVAALVGLTVWGILAAGGPN